MKLINGIIPKITVDFFKNGKISCVNDCVGALVGIFVGNIVGNVVGCLVVEQCCKSVKFNDVFKDLLTQQCLIKVIQGKRLTVTSFLKHILTSQYFFSQHTFCFIGK